MILGIFRGPLRRVFFRLWVLSEPLEKIHDRRLRKEDKESLLKKYPRTGKFCLEPPILNGEVIGSLKESAVKRDDYFDWTKA